MNSLTVLTINPEWTIIDTSCSVGPFSTSASLSPYKKKDKPINLKKTQRWKEKESKLGGHLWVGVAWDFVSSDLTSVPAEDIQIPASQSANLRQMILLRFHATLGVGTVQILVKKKEPVNYFPPASKSWATTKKLYVYVWCFCVVVMSLPVVAGFYCACARVNNIRDLQLSTHMWQSERQNANGCCLSVSQLNKTA